VWFVWLVDKSAALVRGSGEPISKLSHKGDECMGGIAELWLGQLYKLTVLWPAWLLTPEGREALFSRKTLWRLALTVVFALALVALLQALPADLALIGAGDVLTYIDIVAIAWIAGAAGIVRDGLSLAGRSLRRLGTRRTAVVRAPRAGRGRRPRRPTLPANDEDGAGWALAA
jgi:hypothetical protein